jgi:DNA-directed RNA polymerase subunit beta'
MGANILVNEGDEVLPGAVLAKIPRETTKTKDITGGLPRVAELFEARKPKEHAVISRRDRRRGQLRQGHQGQAQGHHHQGRGRPVEYLIPKGKHVNVLRGRARERGEALMDGEPTPTTSCA